MLEEVKPLPFRSYLYGVSSGSARSRTRPVCTSFLSRLSLRLLLVALFFGATLFTILSIVVSATVV